MIHVLYYRHRCWPEGHFHYLSERETCEEARAHAASFKGPDFLDPAQTECRPTLSRWVYMCINLMRTLREGKFVTMAGPGG